jgi:hypothetical protein
MDYATASQAQVGTQLGAPSMPELGRLKAAAERVALARLKIEGFVQRFHGPMPESASADGNVKSESYRNDLDSLFDQLNRLEAAADVLANIG